MIVDGSFAGVFILDLVCDVIVWMCV